MLRPNGGGQVGALGTKQHLQPQSLVKPPSSTAVMSTNLKQPDSTLYSWEFGKGHILPVELWLDILDVVLDEIILSIIHRNRFTNWFIEPDWAVSKQVGLLRMVCQHWKQCVDRIAWKAIGIDDNCLLSDAVLRNTLHILSNSPVLVFNRLETQKGHCRILELGGRGPLNNFQLVFKLENLISLHIRSQISVKQLITISHIPQLQHLTILPTPGRDFRALLDTPIFFPSLISLAYSTLSITWYKMNAWILPSLKQIQFIGRMHHQGSQIRDIIPSVGSNLPSLSLKCFTTKIRESFWETLPALLELAGEPHRLSFATPPPATHPLTTLICIGNTSDASRQHRTMARVVSWVQAVPQLKILRMPKMWKSIPDDAHLIHLEKNLNRLWSLVNGRMDENSVLVTEADFKDMETRVLSLLANSL